MSHTRSTATGEACPKSSVDCPFGQAAFRGIEGHGKAARPGPAIAILVFDNVELLDIAGPHDVFATAAALADARRRSMTS